MMEQRRASSKVRFCIPSGREDALRRPPFLFSEEGATQHPGDAQHRDAEQKPQQKERQADLPPKLHRHPGVVPNTPSKREVYHASHRKLDRGYRKRPCKAAPKKRAAGKTGVNLVEQKKADSAGHRHAPVGVSPPGKLQQAIAERSNGIEDRCFCNSASGHPYSSSARQSAQKSSPLHKKHERKDQEQPDTICQNVSIRILQAGRQSGRNHQFFYRRYLKAH